MKFTFNEKTHSYYLDGKPLTGVTTVLNVIAKPALIGWAAKMATEHIREWTEKYPDVKNTETFILKKELLDQLEEAKNAHRKKKDSAADVGSLVHSAIESWIKEKKQPELDEQGMKMFNHFLKWAEDKKFLESEKKMYSQEWWIGGTVDMVFTHKGKKYVGDIKTTSGIYDRTPFFQMAAYRKMLEEMGEEGLKGLDEYAGACIVRLGKDGSFEEKWSYSYETDLKGFRSALDLYRALKTYKK